MSAVDPRARLSGGDPRKITMLGDKSVVELPYRRAVSLISRGLAEWAKEPPKPRRRRKAKAAPAVEPEQSTLSDAAPEESIVDSAENEPAHPLL